MWSKKTQIDLMFLSIFSVFLNFDRKILCFISYVKHTRLIDRKTLSWINSFKIYVLWGKEWFIIDLLHHKLKNQCPEIPKKSVLTAVVRFEDVYKFIRGHRVSLGGSPKAPPFYFPIFIEPMNCSWEKKTQYLFYNIARNINMFSINL